MGQRADEKRERQLNYRHIYVYEKVEGIKHLIAVVTSIVSVTGILNVSPQIVSTKIDTDRPINERYYVSSYHKWKTVEIEKIGFENELKKEEGITTAIKFEI